MNKEGLYLAVFSVILLTLLSYGSQSTEGNLRNNQKVAAYELFVGWQQKYSKSYREHEEVIYRFEKFWKNYQFVKEHTERFAAGLETFSVQLNKFADLDTIEFSHIYTGYKPKSMTLKCHGTITVVENLPDEVDWSRRAVSPVKNQGMCGSCWAFSACGALEGLAAFVKGSIFNFSAQQLVDCAGPYGNSGCSGGEMEHAFWYVIDHGITTVEKYPYTAKNEKCYYKHTMNIFQNKECARVPANNTKILASAVVKQPVSVAVDANSASFQFYRSGVFSGKCGTELNHGILLTGYGTLDGAGYWKCKNSWGADWGQQGYILLSKTNEDGPGQCGVMMENSVPLQ